jgi:hypothetical protein
LFADREQWKIDLRLVHAKQQTQLQAIQQEIESGTQNRQRVDNTLGALVHPPGSSGNRSMAIEAISARVASQSGHVIARERQTGVINQHIPQQPARLPASIAPEIVMNNIQRGQRQNEDDPFITAVLRMQEAQPSSAPAANSYLVNTKVQLENRSIQLQNLMQQHKFVTDLPVGFPNKEVILKTLTDKIIDNHSAVDNLTHNCPICLEDFTGVAHNTARLPCCSQFIHTQCFAKLIAEGVSTHSRKCPYCRKSLFEN